MTKASFQKAFLLETSVSNLDLVFILFAQILRLPKQKNLTIKKRKIIGGCLLLAPC